MARVNNIEEPHSPPPDGRVVVVKPLVVVVVLAPRVRVRGAHAVLESGSECKAAPSVSLCTAHEPCARAGKDDEPGKVLPGPLLSHGAHSPTVSVCQAPSLSSTSCPLEKGFEDSLATPEAHVVSLVLERILLPYEAILLFRDQRRGDLPVVGQVLPVEQEFKHPSLSLSFSHCPPRFRTTLLALFSEVALMAVTEGRDVPLKFVARGS